MASRYCSSRSSGLYRELKVTILNDLVSRSKRPFGDFQEGEQALQPDVKKQHCGLSFQSQNMSLASAIPSSPSNRIAISQVYSLIPGGDCDDSDMDSTILEFSDGEFHDSPLSVTLEDEDQLLADDLETDTNNILVEFSVKEVGTDFPAATFQDTQLQSISRTLDVSPEPLHPTGLSVCPSSVPPHISAPANPAGAINTSVDSQNQMGFSVSPDRLGFQAAESIEASSCSLKKGDSGSGILEKGAIQTVGEESSPVRPLKAEHEFASVVIDRPSEGHSFIDQSKVAGESANDPPCEEASVSAPEVASDHSINTQNEDHAEDPSPEASEKSSPEETEDPSPDCSKRQRIFIPEEQLQWSKEKYVASVLAHIQHPNIIGAVNELHELMRKVTSEYHFQESDYRDSTNLTMRNYAKRRNREIQKYSLEKWMNLNQRYGRRFAGIPDKFERSPVPSR